MYYSYTTEPEQLPEYHYGIETQDCFVAEDQVDEPKTPTKSRTTVSWHGLLSPQTSGFMGDGSKTDTVHLDVEMSDAGTAGAPNGFSVGETSDRDIPGRENKNDGDVEMVERDAALAREFEEASSPTPMRRSAR